MARDPMDDVAIDVARNRGVVTIDRAGGSLLEFPRIEMLQDFWGLALGREAGLDVDSELAKWLFGGDA